MTSFSHPRRRTPYRASVVLALAFLLICIVVLMRRRRPTTSQLSSANALQIEVYSHPGWWEFRYPQYHFVTANELYVPAGHPVRFTVAPTGVLRAFSIQPLGGARVLLVNHLSQLWVTPALQSATIWIGDCTTSCGASPATTRFLVFAVRP